MNPLLIACLLNQNNPEIKQDFLTQNLNLLKTQSKLTSEVNKNLPSLENGNHFTFQNNIKFGGYVRSFLSPNITLPPKPIFWTSQFIVDSAFFLSYERLIYHTNQFFGLYVGGSLTPLDYQGSVNLASSVYLSMRFYFFEMLFIRPYLHYSVAGPTLLSKNPWGNANFSNHFVFQDTIGVAASLSQKIPLDIGFSVIHYSNGGIFPRNSGIQVPFMLWVSILF